MDRNFNFRYDWLQHRENYSPKQLIEMEDFIEKQKLIDKDSNHIENLLSVNSGQLNEMQLFAYKLIKYFIEKKEQLLMIINGAGGTGKTFTIAAISTLLRNSIKYLIS